MKRGLSVILVCCLIFSCGGRGQELPLAEVPEVPVETLQKADKHESKTGMIVLGVVLAVSVLVNVGLCWKLWKLGDTRKKIDILDRWITTFQYYIKQVHSEDKDLKDSYAAMVEGLIDKEKEYFQTNAPPDLTDAFEAA